MSQEQNVDFGVSNLLDDPSDAPAAPASKPKASKAAKPAAKPTAKPAVEERVRIMLEDNDQVPPGGQFVSVNGVGYLLQAGVELNVPRGVLDVLDHAVMSVPITDEMKSVVAYKDRLRFPYRVLSSSRHVD
jgi:hypothetical protein